MEKPKRGADGIPHSKPGSVDQQMEDTFPASDAPSFTRIIIGAPAGESSAPVNGSAKKKSGTAKKRKSR